MLTRLIHKPKKVFLAAFAPRKTLAALRYVSHKNSKSLPARYDTEIMRALAPQEVDFQHISFTFAIISLSAKLATIDGPLTKESYVAFRDAFPLSGGICGKLRKLFILACNDPTPFEHTVRQVKYLFPRNRDLFYGLSDRLFTIAVSSGSLSKKKQLTLAKIAHLLELSPAQYGELVERHLHPKPHAILGVEKRANAKRIKQRYYQLMRRYHPDVHAGETLSPELEHLLSLRTSEISAAYKTLSKKAA